MSSYDILIKKTKVLLSDKFYDVALLINDNKIAKITKSDVNIRADEVITPKKQFILPGRIDLHVHFRDPGYTHKEDFFTGSCSAIAGGTTFVIDMPNTDPPVINKRNYSKKLEIAKSKSVVDFKLACAVTDDNLNDALATDTDILKAYFRTTNGLKIDTAHFSKIHDTTKKIFIHAEDETLVDKDPINAEISSVQTIKNIHDSEQRLHFCHLTCSQSIEIANEMKNTTLEVCPHYLFFSDKDVRKSKNLLKVNPPIKNEEERLNLWKLLNNNKISAISTDHAPHTSKEKKSDDPPAGVPGVETCLPLMFTQVYENRLPLDIFAKTCFLNPAKIANIYPKKGIIRENSDADLVFITKKEDIIKAENLHTKCDFTPYENMKTKFSVEKTMLRGNIVFEEDEIIVASGFGINIQKNIN